MRVCACEQACACVCVCVCNVCIRMYVMGNCSADHIIKWWCVYVGR